MKKLLFTLLALVSISTMTFAQTSSDIAVTKGSNALVASKADGKFVFKLPSNLTAEDVEQNSKYYTHYFSVSFDAGSHDATVTMNENTEKNRYVIARFLSANGIKFLSVDGENVALYDFIDKYLK